MDVMAVIEEIEGCLALGALNILGDEGDRPSPPFASVQLPSNIDYLFTYDAGPDRMSLTVTVCVSQIGDGKSRRDAIAAYANTNGSKSIKKLLEQGTYTTCDVVVVKSSQFARIKFGDVFFLGVVFALDIAGQGG
jgi:hypothetical protein